jgi:3-dehydroquinate synthase
VESVNDSKFIFLDKKFIVSSYHNYVNNNHTHIFYDSTLDKKTFKQSAHPVDADEKLKSWESIGKIITKFQELGIGREDHILVVGGGTMQDAFGFVCSVYHRGIKWSYMPTTLGAMGDSCYGGKTSINFNEHKNILGTFSDPEKVYIDLTWLETASNNSILSGIGEMMHLFAVAKRYDLMHSLRDEYSEDEPDYMYHVKNSLKIKEDVISRDKFDKGERLKFNYGHTFGHAYEHCTPGVPHGIAVAAGCIMANHISVSCGLLSLELSSYLNSMFSWIEKAADIYSIEKDIDDEFYAALLLDKKNKHGKIGCILMREGDAFLNHLPLVELRGRNNGTYFDD